jgi:microcystin-dependent protein
MSDPYVGEIRIIAFPYAPVGWALCDGQLLPIQQFTQLFSVLGTQFGGDGKSTFGLPNFQGTAPMHQGQGINLSLRTIGKIGGEQAVTLLTTEIPAHVHSVKSAATSNSGSPSAETVFGGGGRGHTQKSYVSPSQSTAVNLNTNAVNIAGENLPHNNMPPYLAMNFVICLQGIFPPRQ